MPAELAAAFTADALPLPAADERGWVRANPAFASWVRDVGLGSARSFLDLPGEIVSGHVSRHVMEVQIGGRRFYLKREHRVGRRERWANWLAGFGRASKSEREGRVLLELERLRLPAPRCVAFGEDGGRAFLLVEGLQNHVELRCILAERPEAQREVTERLGRAVADVHEAGFDHPDLYAKHVLTDRESLAPVLLDWQRSRQSIRLNWSRRIRSLAALHATLPEACASVADRLRFLWAYCRAVRRGPATSLMPRFSQLARAVHRRGERLLHRRGTRAQDGSTPGESQQRLVWLDGEALCAIPEAVGDLSAIRKRLYAHPGAVHLIELPSGRLARLTARRERFSLRRLWAFLRGRAWRSPELRHARLLFHLQRQCVAAPRLLAFGQRQHGLFGPVESFVLVEPLRDPAANGMAPE